MKTAKKEYIVYKKNTDEILAFGTISECCSILHIGQSCFYRNFAGGVKNNKIVIELTNGDEINNLTEYGKAVRSFRKKRKETLISMGAKLNFSPYYLSDIERGVKPVRKDMLEVIKNGYSDITEEEEYELTKGIQDGRATYYENKYKNISDNELKALLCGINKIRDKRLI